MVTLVREEQPERSNAVKPDIPLPNGACRRLIAAVKSSSLRAGVPSV